MLDNNDSELFNHTNDSYGDSFRIHLSNLPR